MKSWIAAAGMALTLAATAAPAARAAAPAPVSEADAYAIGREGYDFLFPLVLMDVTRRAQTTAPAEGQAPRVLAGSFWHWPAFPPGQFRGVVRPNFDTLYSIAWIDVSKGPVTLTAPQGLDRYYLLPLMDMWTDVFAVPGTRTLGLAGGRFLIANRDWHGSVPEGAELVRSPTDTVWLIGRIQTNGPADYGHVHDLQGQLGLQPSAPLPAKPEVDAALDRALPPAKVMAAMPAERFFAYAADLAGRYPPHDIDQPVLARLARIGFRPGQPFDLAAEPPAVQDALRRAAADAFAELKHKADQVGVLQDGWRYAPANVGAYGGDYHLRAEIALFGLGANRPEDAVYPSTSIDAEGRPLTGTSRYVIHFAKDRLPPAGAFWSITAYDPDGFPILNPAKRYAVGDRDPLRYNPDGSLDLYVGKDAPAEADKQANWLPTLDAPFTLTLRIYLPKPAYFDGSWRAPPVTRAP